MWGGVGATHMSATHFTDTFNEMYAILQTHIHGRCATHSTFKNEWHTSHSFIIQE